MRTTGDSPDRGRPGPPGRSRGQRSGRRPGRRRATRRVNPIALAAMLVCLALAGWAARGVLQDQGPAVADFGATSFPAPEPLDTAEPDVDALQASDRADGPTTSGGISDRASDRTSERSPSPGSSPAPAAGSIPPPARSSAALPPAEERARPVRLSLPSLDLVVELDAVGISPDGQMEIPDDVARAGWYRHGPAPGSDDGSVVVAGHVDGTTGPGAFFGLTRLADGAEVVVELDDGTSTSYRVVGGESVAKPDLPVDELFRRDGEPVLRLVTCTGEWSPQAGHYTDNLVITAEPVA